jgi:nucleoside-triphosphatase
VNLEDLETIAVPAIREAATRGRIVVIDEVGKMELFSTAFREAVTFALDAPGRVLATIHLREDPFTRALRARPDVTEIVISRENRDRLAVELSAELG